MKQSCVSAFARVARFCALVAVALGFGAGMLQAQASTGKIEGRVRDQAGAPINNAQITLAGTAFSALTNAQGYYFINNVPAGTVTVHAAFIGYRAVNVSGVKVLAGQTLTQDITMEASTVVLEAINVVSVQPLVPRDEVTTKQRVDADFTSNLPVDRITAALALQPGVVANASNTSLSIRGGRSDENITYIDGVPVQPGNRGTAVFGGNEISVGTGGFEEASVTTGASSAEFGNAQSGVISIATKGGNSERFSGSLGYESDAMFKSSSLGFTRVTTAIGGPLMRGLTFYVSGALEGQKSPGFGMGSEKYPTFVPVGIDTTVAVPTSVGDPASDTTFVDVQKFAQYRGNCGEFANSVNPDIANNYGVACQGVRQPWSPSSVYQLQGKLQYTYGTGSKLMFSALASQSQSRGANFINPINTFGTQSTNRAYILNWTQNLSKSAERALALDVYGSIQQDRAINSPLTLQSELDTRDPFGGFMIKPLDFVYDFTSFPIDSQLIENYRSNAPGTRRSPYDLENRDQYSTTSQYRSNAYGLTGTEESGGPVGTLRLNRENRAIGKANLDWQFDRYNRLKLGGEYIHYDLSNYSHGLTSQAFSSVFLEKPIRWDAFLEDRLDLGDVVVVGGLRYDFYDTRASRPYSLDTVAASPTFNTYQPFPRISSYAGEFNGQPLVSFIRDQSHKYLSPHVQVSFPVTDRTNFRLSYAHQVASPDFGLLLDGINTDLAITNTNNAYGSDLGFGKTITFEFGVRHAFSDDMVLDVSAYNKDKLADAAFRLVSLQDPTRHNSRVDIRELTNADFGNIRGVDVRLDRRFGNIFNGTLAYTYQQAKNTGTDPFTYLNFGSRVINQISGGNQAPPQAIAPTSDSRPHNLAAAASLSFPRDWRQGSFLGTVLRNVGLFATFRYASGTAYTSCEALGNETVTSGSVCAKGQLLNGLNDTRLPTFKQFDLRASKGFRLGGLDLSAYADARNVLNFRNVLAVFVVTGDIVSPVEHETRFAGDSSTFANEAKANGIYTASTGDINLKFGGQGASGCANYVTQGGNGGAPSCVELIRAEQRFGNGDGVFSLAEQQRASDASYYAGRGEHAFLGAGRRVRLGLELNF
ncbi:MAG: TonB-dependent receptor [Bacillota bacterium]|jgi:outer membrane receptor for ferrienterochelin and colicin